MKSGNSDFFQLDVGTSVAALTQKDTVCHHND